MEKVIFASIAVILSLVGYIPYIVDIFKGKTTPHMYSWLVWTVLNLTNCAIYFSNGAGNATIPMSIAFILTFIIFILSIFKGHKDIKKSDFYFLIAAGVAFTFWFFIDIPVIASIIATSTSLIALGPTIRKSWETPYSETLITYVINTIRHILVFLSIATVTLTTAFNPISWFIANLSITLILLYRRSVLKPIK